ncbi:MAG: hypothetical protein NTV63_04135 [Candidatus Woesearchaeota archaeon]|nr:hypothetical protein [Candidatus Woesearchaeota archaeon]
MGSSGFEFFTDAINVTPSTVGSWTAVDVSSYVPSGATGVLLAFVNNGAANYMIVARHPDSTDNFYTASTTDVRITSQIYTVTSINSSRIFEAARENSACNIYLLGYTDEEFGLFTNMVNITSLYSGTGTWQDMNVSSYVPADAKGIILRVYSSTAANVIVARADGSTTNWNDSQVIAQGWYTIIIKNNNQVVEGYRNSANGRFFLIGYINGTAPVTMFTDPYDVSTGTAGSWVNTDVGGYTSTIADGAILVRKNTANSVKAGQSRTVGSTNNWYSSSDIRNYMAHWEFSGLNGTQCFQQKIEANTQDYYIIGYAEPEIPLAINFSNITSSENNFYYNATLLGWCNATQPDMQNVSYYYKWYLNGILNSTGQTAYYPPEILVNIANITSDKLSIGQNWTLECTAYDGIVNSSALNSTEITIVDINSLPNITSIFVDDETFSPAGEIDLIAGDLRQVLCNGTADDPDGFSDIDNVTAVFYASGNGTLPTDPENNNTLYQNNSCSLSAGYDTTKKDFNCSFSLFYYAQNGTWTCNATVNDTKSEASSSIATSNVNNLIALNVSSLEINYGNLAAGGESASSVVFYITNLGNTKIDLSLNGTNMSCAIGAIGASYQHYNITGTDQAYSQMKALSNSPFLSSNFDLNKRITADSDRTTYWRIQVPSGVKGKCTGVISLSAQQG